jgi:hypothetical protein
VKRFIVVLLLLFIASCGSKLKLQHEGEVDTVVSINTAQLEKYFSIYCTNELTTQLGQAPTDDQLKVCVDTMIANFLATVSSGS